MLPDEDGQLRRGFDFLPERSGKRARRSLTNPRRFRKLLSRELGRIIARTGISSTARPGSASPGLTPQPPQFGFQRIQFDAGDADHLGGFGTHAQLPLVRRLPTKV